MKTNILFTILMLFINCANLLAQNVEIDDIAYKLNSNNNTAEVIAKQPKYSGDITIPSTVAYGSKDYAVTSIGVEAFGWCSSLVSVVIPNSVVHIKHDAFTNTNFSTINIPHSVINIDFYAFSNSDITSIIIPNGVPVIEERTFGGCFELSSVTIPSSAQLIKNSAFYWCYNLSVIKNLSILPVDISSFTNVFHLVEISECTLTVPTSSVTAYQNAPIWQDFNIVGGGLLVNPTVNNNLYGYTEGNDLYASGATATVTATPRTSCNFLNWTIDGVVVSTEATYSFTVTEDVVLVANFEAFANLVNVTINNPDYGTVTGGGYFPQYSTVTLTATANFGYKFEKWIKEGEEITTNPYNFTLTGDTELSANFREKHQYAVNLSVNNPDYGSAYGSGTYYEDEYATAYAVAKPGHDFMCWLQYGIVVSTNASYTCLVTSDMDLTASFVPKQSYIVNLTANNPTYGTVLGSGIYLEGETVGFYAMANEGYILENWTRDGEIVSTNTHYVCTITENLELIANFRERLFYTVNLSVNNAAYGSVYGGGTYYERDTVSFHAVANEGYVFESWTLDGAIVSANANYMCIITKDMNLVANFIVHKGIEDNELAEISIYPNPTSGVLRIESGELRVENVEVFNMMGKICMVENLRQNMDNVLDVSYLPAGMYFVRITTENGVVTRKILKQ